jgi:hypothetical protein
MLMPCSPACPGRPGSRSLQGRHSFCFRITPAGNVGSIGPALRRRAPAQKTSRGYCLKISAKNLDASPSASLFTFAS